MMRMMRIAATRALEFEVNTTSVGVISFVVVVVVVVVVGGGVVVVVVVVVGCVVLSIGMCMILNRFSSMVWQRKKV